MHTIKGDITKVTNVQAIELPDRSCWKNAGNFTDVRLERQRLQRLTIFPVNM